MRLVLCCALLLAACGGAGSGGIASPSASVIPAPSGTVGSEVLLKYRLLDQFGPLAYCDPDFYPIARADEASLAKQHEPDMRADADTWAALMAHHPIIQIAIFPPPPLTGEQLLPLYRDWKMLRAMALTPSGGAFAFSQRFMSAGGGRDATLIEGTIDRAGTIAITKRTPNSFVNCPICLAAGTRIATPLGEVAVESLSVGMSVWTADASGARVDAVVRAIGSTPVPSTHEIVALALTDGRGLLASPGHPTSDGRHVGELRAGDTLDGAIVASAERVRYAGGFTFDLLPSGVTGTYWANGVLLGSTLR
ncbi:MAG: Hint domain-containing protein [Chloroflexi bacterium]|nr:Hint domain-containing protein [Chloroflexota bacterium]